MGYANRDAILDELDSWMLDSKSFGARKMRCPNKSASGKHLG
jgi:hypothetical protein